MNIPTKTGPYTMPADVVLAYRRLYPSAEYEFAQMLVWLETNRARRPASPSSAPRFVANWFRRVPKIAPRTDARMATVQALIGESNVIEIGTASDRMGGSHLREDGDSLWGAKDVVDVDWCEPRKRQTLLG